MAQRDKRPIYRMTRSPHIECPQGPRRQTLSECTVLSTSARCSVHVFPAPSSALIRTRDRCWPALVSRTAEGLGPAAAAPMASASAARATSGHHAQRIARRGHDFVRFQPRKATKHLVLLQRQLVLLLLSSSLAARWKNSNLPRGLQGCVLDRGRGHVASKIRAVHIAFRTSSVFLSSRF